MRAQAIAFIVAFNWFVFLYFVIWNSSYFLFNVLAFVHLRERGHEYHRRSMRKLFQSGFYEPVSVLIPAHNEAHSIVQTVRSALHLEYPEFEVVVVNDGSDDDTLAELARVFELRPMARPIDPTIASGPIRGVYVSRPFPNLVVVDKENAGKSDALNAGLRVARHPLFCSIDADSILERDCLLRVTRPFLDDDTTIAVGGTVRIANGCHILDGENTEVGVPKSSLGRFQIVEYLRAFLFGRVGLAALNSLLVTSGAFSIFRRAAVVEVGGFMVGAVGEDMEIICRLHRRFREAGRPYRITFVPDPVCWTEVPETLRPLGRQRDRWQRGLIDSLSRHIVMLGNPRYGGVGLFAVPYFVFFEMLGPIVELLGYFTFGLAWSLGVLEPRLALLFFVAAVLLGFALSVSSLFLEELSFRRYPRWSQMAMLLVYGVLENFGYRQLTLWWRLRGTLGYMFGSRDWERRDPVVSRQPVTPAERSAA